MLIGLAGFAGSGKDSVYGILRAMSFDPEKPLSRLLVRRDAFADRLKVSAAKALGIEGDWDGCIEAMNTLKTEGSIISILSLFKRTEISGREYLQRYGTEGHREIFGQDFWVKAVLPDGYPSDDDQEKTLLVITDVRFPNEAERVRECGGQVWRVQRPLDLIRESNHASEQPLDDSLIDLTIYNDRGLDHLFQAVELAAERLFR